jgi:hypothetical protein
MINEVDELIQTMRTLSLSQTHKQLESDKKIILIVSRLFDLSKQQGTTEMTAEEHKQYPLFMGLFGYFPDALIGSLTYLGWVMNNIIQGRPFIGISQIY